MANLLCCDPVREVAKLIIKYKIILIVTYLVLP